MSKAFFNSVLWLAKHATSPSGRKTNRRQGKTPAQSRGRTLRVESLESRRLLTGTTIALDASNNLLITGNTAGSNLGVSYNTSTSQYTITDASAISTAISGATGSGTTTVTIPES